MSSPPGNVSGVFCSHFYQISKPLKIPSPTAGFSWIMEARICIKIVSLLHERLINVTIGQSAKPQARRLQGRPSILMVSEGLWPAFLRGTTRLLWGSPNQKTGGQGDNRWDRSRLDAKLEAGGKETSLGVLRLHCHAWRWKLACATSQERPHRHRSLDAHVQSS